MTAENLWLTARRVLGVYFVLIGLLNVPAAFAVLGYETANVPRWALLITPVGQGIVALVAGWWLLRSSRSVREEQGTDSKPAFFLAPVLLLMGVYFVVEGCAAASGAAVEIYSFGEAWQIRTGNLADAAVKLVAGVVLLAKPSEISQKILGFAKLPA
jgi:hypothetical protein